jgi:hypothetical protein
MLPTLTKLLHTQQPPPRESWESRTAGSIWSTVTTDSLLPSILDFLHSVPSTHAPVPLPMIERRMEEERELQRQSTLASFQHQRDHFLRQCVRVVGQHCPQRAKEANRIRQTLLKSTMDDHDEMIQSFLSQLQHLEWDGDIMSQIEHDILQIMESQSTDAK